MKEKVRSIIETAIEVLEATGWHGGRLGEINIARPDSNGAHCALGALAAAAHIRGELVGEEKNTPFSQERFDPYLERRGWYDSTPYVETVRAVWSVLPREFQTAEGSAYETLDIYTFNDSLPASKDQGRDEVLALFRRALENS